MPDKQIIDEMKSYFNVSSLEDVAEIMGYKRSTAATWRSRGFSKSAILTFEKMKSDDAHVDQRVIEAIKRNPKKYEQCFYDAMEKSARTSYKCCHSSTKQETEDYEKYLDEAREKGGERFENAVKVLFENPEAVTAMYAFLDYFQKK